MSLPEAQLRLAERNPLFEARAKQYLKETASPETLDGLAMSHPLKGQPFILIFYFTLRRELRPDGREAPCPICSPNAPKYFDGALAWFPVEGVYRCIGRECAGHFIGKAQSDAAKREFKERRSRDADYEFLAINLGVIPSMIRYFEALLPAAIHADKLRHRLGAAHVREPLGRVVKNHDGRLVVWDTIEAERFDPTVNDTVTIKERVPIDFGLLAGPTAVVQSFDVPRKIKNEIGYLGVLNKGEQATAEEWVINEAWNYAEDMRLACYRLRNANALQPRALTKIKDVLSFFTDENFEQLAKFGDDHRNSISLFAAVRNGQFRIGPTMSQCVSIRPEFDLLHNLPEWPTLKAPPEDGALTVARGSA